MKRRYGVIALVVLAALVTADGSRTRILSSSSSPTRDISKMRVSTAKRVTMP
jgi:hypothetical protein